jgi:cAMP-dependent protein kinase regulator
MSAPTTTFLDQAWDAILNQRTEPGLRMAVAMVEGDRSQLGAVTLLIRALDSLGRGSAKKKHLAKLVEAWSRRGDLPQAVAAAHLAKKESAALLKNIAEAFGKGSNRLKDVSPAPPALPLTPELGELAKLSGNALLERAERALDGFGGWDDPVKAGGLPSLPLFSALPARALERLLTLMEVREYASGERVITQGEEGKEAYVVVRGSLRAQRHTSGNVENEDDGTVLAVLGPGAIFGEMALVSDSPRAASVHAQEPTRVLVMKRSDLEALAKDEDAVGHELSSFCRARMIANLVRTSAILRAAPPPQREAFMSRFSTAKFEPGDALVHEGAEVGSLFLIASGHVRVVKEEEGGESLILAELGPGDVVGEIGVVLRRPATATVVATHPTVALELTRKAFEDAIKEHPALLGELYQLATQRDEETRSIVAQEVMDVEADVLL